MPFIDSKITGTVSEEKKEAIKTRLGQAISILNKSETYLMVGFEDNYDLFMAGQKLEKGAYVSEDSPYHTFFKFNNVLNLNA